MISQADKQTNISFVWRRLVWPCATLAALAAAATPCFTAWVRCADDGLILAACSFAVMPYARQRVGLPHEQAMQGLSL